MTKEQQVNKIIEKLSDERAHKDKVSLEIKERRDWLDRIVWNNPKQAQEIIDEVFEEEAEK